MSSAAPHRAVLTVRGDTRRERRDRLAGEEPMEIRVAPMSGEPRPVAVTMRTPGHDLELAAGFLVTEGIVAPGGVRRVAYCDDVEGDQLYNVVTVRTDGPIALGEGRRVASTSACGICGKASLDDVEVRCAPLGEGPRIARRTLLALPDALRAGQRVFDATGGLHAAGLFDAGGRLLTLREDIGRHNAVDKVVGAAALAGELPAADRVLMVSGRAGFEIVQKAAVAGIPILAAVSAPSSLAVEAAERLGMTLVGFLRGDGFNLYAGRGRIVV
jgi:FdhD protein